MAFKVNPANCIDFYKASHKDQYPEGTTKVYSNLTARGNRLVNLPDKNEQVVMFGLQYFIKSFLLETFNDEFFKKPLEEVLAQHKRRMTNALGPFDVSHIEALHKLGYLPLEIRALPEGSIVDMKIPLLTVTNTKPEFFWLTNYIESILSAELWKPIVSASTSRWYRRTLAEYAERTGSPAEFVQFQGHDFSFRGMSGVHDAALSGAGHLLSFSGTDTVPAIDLLEQYYGADSDKELVGCSVPATEHSVMCMGGKEDEIETFRRLMKTYPSGILSIVSDTWDFWKVVTEYVTTLKPEIMARTGGPVGDKIVIRPDSGDPVHVICGLRVAPFMQACYDENDRWNNKYDAIQIDGKYYDLQNGMLNVQSLGEPLREAEVKGAVQCLWDVFGGTETDKGFKMLDSHIGLIYGDSITPERAIAILERLAENGFASGNVVFGVGSFTFQHVTRDTYSLAVKSTYGEVNGEARMIFKDPITDSGVKKSAKGLLKVTKDATGTFHLQDQVTEEEMRTGELVPVFRDGHLLEEYTLAQIRKRAQA